MRFALPLAGLLALGVLAPLAAHLLSRRPPSARPFPTLRFLRATPTAARRLRTLHDRTLWALRTTIVLVITGAAAGPTLVTARREATWQPPLIRAVVTAPGLEAPGLELGLDLTDGGDDGRAPTAGTTWPYEARPVRASIAAAIHDLNDRVDSPRELVVRWDGRRQALEPADLDAVPAQIGLRLDVIPSTNHALAGAAIDIRADPADDAARRFMIDAVPWRTSTAPMVAWPGAEARGSLEQDATPPSPAIADLFRRMRLDPRLSSAAQRSLRDARVPDTENDRLDRTRFEALARSATGSVLLWGAMAGDRPLLILDARVTDPVALWSLRAVADASLSAGGWPLPDTLWTRDEIDAAQRPPVHDVRTVLPGGLDTRWWWLATLALVIIEGIVRRRRAPGEPQAASPAEDRDAA